MFKVQGSRFKVQSLKFKDQGSKIKDQGVGGRGYRLKISISAEDIAGVNFRLDVVQTGVVAICDDGLGHFLEFLQVIHHQATEEGGAVFEGGLVDDDLRALGLDALHNTLDGTLAEVVTVTLHREAVNADGGNCDL